MRTLNYILGIVLLFALAGARGARAQDQQQPTQQDQPQDQSAAPIPAYHSPLASEADTGEENAPADYTPDTSAITGGQNFSVGTPEGNRSYWQPHADVVITADSNGLQSTGTNWTTWSSLYGGINAHRVSGNSDLTLGYTAGGTISNGGSDANGVVQGLNFADKMVFRRETVSIFEQLSYLPETAFGFGGLGGGGFGGISLPGAGGLGLAPGLTPDQTILTSQGGEILSNSVLVEGDTVLSSRSSLTLLGGYSLLHYFGSSELDYGDVNGRIGYNRQVTHADTIGISYTYSGIKYSNFDQTIDNHVAQISYGRRLTGRLAFQISGGPELSIFSTPIVANAGASPSTSQVYWTLSSSLQYHLQRTGVGASYFHGVSGGSGVLPGAISDTVSANATRQLTRTIGSNFNFGYSRNEAVNVAAVNSSNYNYWFGGASLSRPWGRNFNVSLWYQLQYQDASSSFCIGSSCSTNFIRHLISVTLDWHPRPRAF
jgi:hypothetical protein